MNTKINFCYFRLSILTLRRDGRTDSQSYELFFKYLHNDICMIHATLFSHYSFQHKQERLNFFEKFGGVYVQISPVIWERSILSACHNTRILNIIVMFT